MRWFLQFILSCFPHTGEETEAQLMEALRINAMQRLNRAEDIIFDKERTDEEKIQALKIEFTT